jgi:cytochrome c2
MLEFTLRRPYNLSYSEWSFEQHLKHHALTSATSMTLVASWLCLLMALFAFANSASAAFYFDNDMDGFVSEHSSPLMSRSSVVKSNMYDLIIEWIEIPQSPATGGALIEQDDILIIVRPRGEVAWINLRKRQGPYETRIAAPLNLAELLSSGIPEKSKLNMAWFRAAGAYVESLDQKLRLYVTHHVFEKSCFFLQLSAVDLKFDRKMGLIQDSDWKIIFRPDPCIQIGDASFSPFAGNQAGGKIVELDKNHLLVAYGDHEVDGYKGANSPQDPDSPYGKLWKIAKNGESASIFTMGMRNPQGLYIDDKHRIWESEHGPQGGDELNFITEGSNYGWPSQTYGVFYGGYEWPLNRVQGDHSDNRYRAPVFAWIPSIAPTSLTQIQGSRFALWRGDLLLATLKDQSLRRLRLDRDSVVYDERIPVGQRVRDLVALKDGRLAMLADGPLVGLIDASSSNLQQLGAAKPSLQKTNEAGSIETIFNTKCASCHSLSAVVTAGPPLAGVAGRTIGKYPGFTYSPALAKAHGTWTSDLFVSFVTAPSKHFPGSTMPPVDVTPQQAERIYDYLAAALPGQPHDQANPTNLKNRRSADAADKRWLVTLADVSGDDLAALEAKRKSGPFAVPFALEKRPVGAYEELAPGFWVGFDAEANSSIFIGQITSTHASTSLLDQKYAIEIEVRDIGSTQWASVEQTTELLGDTTQYRLIMEFKAKLSLPSSVDLHLFIPQTAGPDHRLPLASVHLSNQYGSAAFSKIIDVSELPNINRAKPPRAILFLPLRSGLTIELASFDVSLLPLAPPK